MQMENHFYSLQKSSLDDLGLCLEHEKEKGHDSNGFLKRRTSHKMQVKNIEKERN